MTFGSLFAGIEGFGLGFGRAGMQYAWRVEKDPDACRVLIHHAPHLPLFDDVRTVGKRNLSRVDVIAGGFPCQDLSVAGRRSGLTGERSGLFWEMVRIVDELRPRFLVWENVPGLFSSVTANNSPPACPAGVDSAGRFDGPAPTWLLEEDSDFEAVLWGLARIGYFGAWRRLDSQYFGLAQRRKRVFGVFARGRAGADRAAEILALTGSGSRHPATGRTTGKDVAATLRSRTHGTGVNPPGRGGEDDANLVVARCLTGKKGHRYDGESDTLIAHTLTGNGFDASEDGTGRGTPLVVCASTAHTLNAVHRGVGQAHNTNYVAFQQNQRDEVRIMPVIGALSSQPGMKQQTYLAGLAGVRRLMPVECLRLQGFPDDWLDLDPPLSDSAKYRMIGNAVSVPVAEWIGRRLAAHANQGEG